ncbi:MAG: PAS domain S-box protein [Coriobacteriia bacterium]
MSTCPKAKNTPVKRPADYLPFVALLVLPLLLYPAVDNSAWTSSGDVHAVLEFTSSLLAITAGVMILLHFLSTGRWFYLMISNGFVLIGSEEFVHALFSYGRLGPEAPLAFRLAVSSTWLTGQLVLAISLLLALALGKREVVPAKRAATAAAYGLVGLVCAAFVTLLIFRSPFLPEFVRLGSTTKRSVELFLALLFFTTFLLYTRVYLKERQRSPLLWSIVAFIIFRIWVHIFVFDAQAFYDSHWDVAHLSVLLSYFLPIFGVWGEAIRLQRSSEAQVVRLGEEMNERRLAEEALGRSRSLLQSVVNGTSDAIYVKDLAGRYLLFNHAAEVITGKTSDEVLGNDDTLLFPAEEAEIVMAGDRTVMEGGMPKTYDEQLTVADGTLHFYLSTKGPLLDLGGRPYGLFGIAHDITDRRKAEEELRASEERYRSLMEQAADGIFITDPDGSYVDVNAAGCAMLGYAREEILGKRISDLVDPADVAATPLRLEELQRGRTLLAERVLVRKDGSKVPVEISARPLQDGRLQAILRDTTERKAAEAELRALSSRQEAILAAVLDIIAEVDSNKVYTWVNEAGRRFFGDDVVGHEASDYFLGEQETYLRVEPLFHGSSDTVYVESWQRRRDGEKRLLGWWCRALTDENGASAGALSTARDITEHKAAEDELVRIQEHLEELVEARTKELQAMNEQLVEATAAKDEFLAGMSHELRTPLNSIIGFSGVLLSGAAGALDEEQRKQISMISTSGHRLLDLVNDLLDIERVESGRVVLVPEVFDPCEVMTEVVESVRPLAEEKDLRLRPGSIEGTGLFFGDRRVVAQVLMNLCANAVKYTDAGAVDVVCRASGGGGLEYEVTDTGPGIPNEDLTGIFDKFVRLRRRGATIPSGTGLGLALAKRLAMEHGGDVTVRSVVGEGSAFTARFAPCRPQDA